MRFKSGKEFIAQPNKAITVMGMSGVGKTTLAAMLQGEDWFQYSVDYRIGTRYMDEYIVDNFKREAMHNPFLRELLRSDSIYIRSNITFDNLAPLSTYLGKPGRKDLGGISMAEYKQRQAQHHDAEIRALLDVPEFIKRAAEIYGYGNFVCDSGGSLCEVVNPDDANDPVLKALAENTVIIYIEGTPEHAKMLVDRFRKHPKPMYYQSAFLDEIWAKYKALNGVTDESTVIPNDFAAWGFEQLLHHRIPLYRKIAQNFGYTISMHVVPELRCAEDVTALIAKTIDQA
jgi:shikimate kinase